MGTTPANVAVPLGLSIPGQDDETYQQWTQWISDAELILRVGDGVHDGLGDLSLLDQEIVDYVVREAVAAHVRRPDDATTVEIAVDDGRTSRTYQSGAGRVVIRDEWWAMLQPTTGRSAAAWSTRPSYQPDCPPWR